MRVFLALVLAAGTCCGQAFGTWKMNPARSVFAGAAKPKSLTVRIEPHPKGEVFTLERLEPDGRTTSSSSILYLDGEPRSFVDFGCSGIQSSRRADERTVEIVRMCASGGWMRLVKRSAAKSNELVLEITEQPVDGSRVERRLILERQ